MTKLLPKYRDQFDTLDGAGQNTPPEATALCKEVVFTIIPGTGCNMDLKFYTTAIMSEDNKAMPITSDTYTETASFDISDTQLVSGAVTITEAGGTKRFRINADDMHSCYCDVDAYTAGSCEVILTSITVS